MTMATTSVCGRCGSRSSYRDETGLRCLACNRPIVAPSASTPQPAPRRDDSGPRECRLCGIEFVPDRQREAITKRRIEAEGRTYASPKTCSSCRLALELRRLGDGYRVVQCRDCADSFVASATIPRERARCGNCRHGVKPRTGVNA